MNRRSLIKSFAGIAGIPAITKSQIADIDKPKLLILSFDDYLPMTVRVGIHKHMEKHFPGWKLLILDGRARFEIRDLE
jgi:hypothetical protein